MTNPDACDWCSTPSAQGACRLPVERGQAGRMPCCRHLVAHAVRCRPALS